jgi:hypothetical protein
LLFDSGCKAAPNPSTQGPKQITARHRKTAGTEVLHVECGDLSPLFGEGFSLRSATEALGMTYARNNGSPSPPFGIGYLPRGRGGSRAPLGFSIGVCPPPFAARYSPFRRRPRFRVESGAKASHSMECGDSSPLFGEGFSLHHLAVGLDGTRVTGRAAPDPPIHTTEGPACQVHIPLITR